jgi:predicted amidohydrolase YtcJ
MIAQAPDLIVHNAHVRSATFAAAVPAHAASAFAVAAGRIIALGDDRLLETAARGTRTLDLAGRLVVPGFFDSHNHLLGTALGRLLPQLASARSVRDVLAVVADTAARLAPGAWVHTSPRWHESNLAERRFPTRRELDAVAPAHPVLIKRGGHNVVVNSVALSRLGISDDAPNPPGGTLVRDGAGKLTGHIIGAPYINTLVSRIPEASDDAKIAALGDAGQEYARHGITSVVEPGLQPHDIALFQSDRARASIGLRTHLMWRVAYAGEPVQDVVEAIARGVVAPTPGDDVSVFGIKMSVDGGVETGYYREPYAAPDDAKHPRGKPLTTPEDLYRICLQAALSGWHVGLHCVGDAAIDMALDAFERVDAEVSLAERRWSIIHAIYPRPDHWSRIRRLRLTITAQQPLFYALGAGFQRYLGAERANAMNPLSTILSEVDFPVGGGSDSPVAPYDPLIGIASSVSRAIETGTVLGVDERITATQALAMYTLGSAYCAFQEGNVGSLEVGKAADFTVLSHDILTEPASIQDSEVVYTARGGEVTFDAL